MNIKELKDILKGILKNLEKYNNNEQVDVATNTYFLNKKYCCKNMLKVSEGFINLDFPTSDIEEE